MMDDSLVAKTNPEVLMNGLNAEPIGFWMCSSVCADNLDSHESLMRHQGLN